MPPGFDPWSGSVSPKHPIHSPVASLGRNFCFCSSDPYFQMGYITSELWTEAVERKPLSQRSSSCMISPYAIWSRPAPPYSSGMYGPNAPISPKPGNKC